MVARSIQNIVHKIGIGSYRFNQKYVCIFEYSFVNHTNQKQSLISILPCPTLNYHRSVKINESFPREFNKKCETHFENEYFVASIDIDAGSQKTLTYSCLYYSVPITIHPSKHWKISQYDYSTYTRYLEPNRFIQSNTSELTSLYNRVLSIPSNSVVETVNCIRTYILKTLRYGNPIDGLYSSQEAMTRNFVDCGGYSTLFVALCQKAGIPARIVSGFWLGKDSENNTMHAWAEYAICDGTWIPVDLDIEQLRQQGRTYRYAGINSIGSDRIVTCLGCDLQLDVNGMMIQTDILQQPFFVSAPTKNEVKLKIIITK